MNGDFCFDRAEVSEACLRYGPLLHLDGLADDSGQPLDGASLMWAFALNESIVEDGLFKCPPRFEPAYAAGGRYARDPYQAELNRRFAADGAKSYGPWQIMLYNARGFIPVEFRQLDKCALAFLGFFNRLAMAQKPTTLDQLADAYNSGNWRDSNVPHEYVARLRRHYYQEALAAPGP